MGIRMAVEVGATLRDDRVAIVSSMPRVGTTTLLVALSHVLRVVDCQVQSHHRVATRSISILESVRQIVARYREVRMFVPVETLASRG